MKISSIVLYSIVLTMLLPTMASAELGHWMVWRRTQLLIPNERMEEGYKVPAMFGDNVKHNERCAKLRQKILGYMERGNEIRVNTLVLLYTRLCCSVDILIDKILEE